MSDDPTWKLYDEGVMRMPVPGGWLFQITHEHWGPNTVFVPEEPQAEWTEVDLTGVEELHTPRRASASCC